jgi:hypothetical protein
MTYNNRAKISVFRLFLNVVESPLSRWLNAHWARLLKISRVYVAWFKGGRQGNIV